MVCSRDVGSTSTFVGFTVDSQPTCQLCEKQFVIYVVYHAPRDTLTPRGKKESERKKQLCGRRLDVYLPTT